MKENSEGMKKMSVEIKTDEDVVTAFLSGEIDHHVALPIREKTDAAIISAHPKRVVLDFSGVTFMDSSGIGLVMGRYKICESMGASLEIHGLSRHAYKVMCLAGLQNLAVLKKKKEAEKSETA